MAAPSAPPLCISPARPQHEQGVQKDPVWGVIVYLALELRRLFGVLGIESFGHHRIQTAASFLPPRLFILCLKT